MDRYVIRGGRQGYDRLQLLARDRWPDTAALLERAAVRPGQSAVDIGCGGGAVSLELARLVGSHGHVTGIDMDGVKLDLARAAAAELGLDNVEFRIADIEGWDAPDAYDVVYSRNVLQHLSHPVEVLRRMWSAVRAGGMLLAEDADFDGWCCYPPNPGFDFFVRSYARVIERRGGDHASGRKLFAHFLEAGIPRPRVHVVQPVHTDGDLKTLAWSTLDATADSIVSDGDASRDEVERALAGLKRLTEDPGSVIVGPRIFQLWSQRGSS